MVTGPGRSPSPLFGARLALRLWPLAAVLTVAQLLAAAPVVIVLERSLGRAMAALPGDVSAAEAVLVAREALAAAGGALSAALVAALVAAWVLAVVVRAGVVTWRTWAEGTAPRLGPLLALGCGRFLPFLRLGLATLVLHAVAQTVLWVPLGWAVRAAHQAMAEARMERLLWLGAALTPLLVLLVWAASLRAAWLLGRPDRRSAVAALLRGLVASLAAPFSSLGTVVGWAVAGWAASLLPLAAAAFVPLARHGGATAALGVVAGLLAASCALALLASFAPTAGLVTTGDRR